MSIGISVNVGLNKVTSNVFQADPLTGAERDATAMHVLAKDRGFDQALSTLLIGPDATLDKVKNAVKAAAGKLQSGDLFLFTFSGHGTFKVNPSAPEEPDKHDESIVLTDHLLLDNCWRNELWPLFNPGVRAVAIADCCHSETALIAEQPLVPGPARRLSKPKPAARAIADIQRQNEMQHFPEIYKAQGAPGQNPITCTRIFLSACLDGQMAADGPQHGAFTGVLLRVWNNGVFAGNYNEFMAKIQESFKTPSQTPALTALGNPNFSTERPFTI